MFVVTLFIYSSQLSLSFERFLFIIIILYNARVVI